MGRNKILLSPDDLRKLYWGKNMATRKVASILGCTDGTVISRMRELGMPRRDKTSMRVKYPKYPFRGSLAERAYMIGFRLGDLNVYKPSPASKILVVRCHTTSVNQVDLIRQTFKKYGGVRVTHRGISFTVNCFVDDSFNFLQSKKLPQKLIVGQNSSVAFIAGYTDAEGSFGLNQGKGRFTIASYDYEILKFISKLLKNQQIAFKFQRIARKGHVRSQGGHWNNDLWRININIAVALEKFIGWLKPFLRHRKRIADAQIVLNNIYERRSKGTI